MKKLIALLVAICILPAFGSEFELKQITKIAERELQAVSSQHGYEVKATRLSLPETNWLIPISGVGTIVPLGVALAVLPFTSAAFIAPSLVVISGISLEETDPILGAKILFLNHNRYELHYELHSLNNSSVLEGSCIYFVKKTTPLKFRYEIDNCNHDEIFPQNTKGILRVGSEVDFIERYITGQANVVATGTEVWDFNKTTYKK